MPFYICSGFAHSWQRPTYIGLRSPTSWQIISRRLHSRAILSFINRPNTLMWSSITNDQCWMQERLTCTMFPLRSMCGLSGQSVSIAFSNAWSRSVQRTGWCSEVLRKEKKVRKAHIQLSVASLCINHSATLNVALDDDTPTMWRSSMRYRFVLYVQSKTRTLLYRIANSIDIRLYEQT